jgi:hypothetical protein
VALVGEEVVAVVPRQCTAFALDVLEF